MAKIVLESGKDIDKNSKLTTKKYNALYKE